MLGCGCGVSQYPQFFDRELDKYQLLPRPYLVSFEGYPGENPWKKNGWQTWQAKHKYLFWNILKVEQQKDIGLNLKKILQQRKKKYHENT